MEDSLITWIIIGGFVTVIVYYLLRGKGESKKKRSVAKGATASLELFAHDLTKAAMEKELDPVIGRKEEIDRVIQILSRRRKNNPILLGDPGVGKTAIAEGLAQRIAKGDVPSILNDKRVLSLQVSEMLAGTKYRGEFEERAKQIVDEIQNQGRTIILFVDEAHVVMQTAGTEGAVNFSDILKPALARGDLQMIAATTVEEYEKYIKPEKSLERRFQPVVVGEPSVGDTIKILQGVKSKYEDHHKVTYTDAAIKAAANLSKKYIKGRYLPDKAIDLIDEAAAMVKIRKMASKKKKGRAIVDAKHIKEVVSEWVAKK